MSIQVLLFCIFFGLSFKAFGNQSTIFFEQFCQGQEIQHLQRPIIPDDPKSPKFDYVFRYIPGTDPNLPVIVFLPGGPGATSIFYGGVQDIGLGVPKKYGIILTDPRGTGCNGKVSTLLSNAAHSTSIWASDIIAILKAVNPSKYILMGHSYGTVLATVVASQIELEKNLIPTTGVVLVAALGHAFLGADEQYQGLFSAWESLKIRLHQRAVDLLSIQDLPLGLSKIEWGKFIFQGLVAGSGPGVPEAQKLETQLNVLATGNKVELERLKTEVQKVGAHQSSMDFLRASKPIWCRELAAFDNTDVALESGKLIGFQDIDFCKGLSLNQPYDSAHWPIRAPIFYIQGNADPAVVSSQASYHFQKQTTSHRFFISVPEAGHFPIAALFDCKEKLWSAIVDQGRKLESSLNFCSWPIRIDEARANE